MIKVDNKELRNLEEQVLKNKEDIAELEEIDVFLNGVGIQVQGVVSSSDELPTAEQMGENYGYAYLVGTEPPYDMYVWTRPNPNAGQLQAYFVNLGDMAVVGPQGPKGDKGDQGDTGTRGSLIVTNNRAPVMFDTSITIMGQTINFLANDCWIDTTTGTLYQCQSISGDTAVWLSRANIKGPMGIQGIQGPAGETGPVGPQGPKGDTGDVGGFINIAGIVASTSQLPSPEALHDLTKAYLVGAASPYNLYVQVGETSATALWTDMGPLNVATYVTVNGLYQNTWNADTKVDKLPAATGKYVYTRIAGYEGGTQMATAADAYSVMERDGLGIAHVSNAHMNLNDAQYDTEIINKSVLKTALDGYVKIIPDSDYSEMAYGRSGDTELAWRVSQTANGGTLVRRNGNGTIDSQPATISSASANNNKVITVSNLISNITYKHDYAITYESTSGSQINFYMVGYSNDRNAIAITRLEDASTSAAKVQNFINSRPVFQRGSYLYASNSYDILSVAFNADYSYLLLSYWDHINNIVAYAAYPLKDTSSLPLFGLADTVTPSIS